MVVSRSGTKIRSFLACSTALRIASGTSWALPSATPTWPRPSPTTTSAGNEHRRPPFTTFATRLIETTRSFNSSTLGSIFASATTAPCPSYAHILCPHLCSVPSPLVCPCPHHRRRRRSECARCQAPAAFHAGRVSKDETAGAGGVSQRLHAPVILVSPAIEHHLADPARLGLLRQELAHGLGGGHIAAGPVLAEEVLAAAVYREQRLARVVVDELGIDVTQAAKDRKPGSLRGAADVTPQPEVPLVARRAAILGDHFAPAFLPTFRRTTSPAYLMPLPL